MAKDKKDKKGGKPKVKTSKQVGGVKVGKSLRKAGNQALKLVEQPAVSELVGAALLAAAAALRDPPKTKKTAQAAADAAGDAGQEAIRIGDSLRKIAIDFARRTLDSWEEADSKARGGARGGGSGASQG